ncbi:hypothetical protein PF003_g16150 [Phytophthora fragariae]|nr:hypothetical protein PF003_g16150 [Phytophthora fragariae]
MRSGAASSIPGCIIHTAMTTLLSWTSSCAIVNLRHIRQSKQSTPRKQAEAMLA